MTTSNLLEWLVLRLVLVGLLAGCAVILPLLLIGAAWDGLTGSTGHCPDRRLNPYAGLRA